MIFSSIYVNDDAGRYPQAIQTAIAYLKDNDFVHMEPGVYEIQGKEIYAQVFDAETGAVSERRPEVHEKYVDVQFLAGKNWGLLRIRERMKWTNGLTRGI